MQYKYSCREFGTGLEQDFERNIVNQDINKFYPNTLPLPCNLALIYTILIPVIQYICN